MLKSEHNNAHLTGAVGRRKARSTVPYLLAHALKQPFEMEKGGARRACRLCLLCYKYLKWMWPKMHSQNYLKTLPLAHLGPALWNFHKKGPRRPSRQPSRRSLRAKRKIHLLLDNLWNERKTLYGALGLSNPCLGEPYSSGRSWGSQDTLQSRLPGPAACW